MKGLRFLQHENVITLLKSIATAMKQVYLYKIYKRLQMLWSSHAHAISTLLALLASSLGRLRILYHAIQEPRLDKHA